MRLRNSRNLPAYFQAFWELMVGTFQRVISIAGICGAMALLTACGPTVVSTQIAASMSDPNARIELRNVQPDPLDPWTTNELWGVNLSNEPVCGGYRERGMSWTSFLMGPQSARRLLGLGNGGFSGTTSIKAMRNGQACTDAFMAVG